MNQTPMTTREAVELALKYLNMCHWNTQADDAAERLCAAAQTLCEAYNFKLSDFFDNAPSDA